MKYHVGDWVKVSPRGALLHETPALNGAVGQVTTGGGADDQIGVHFPQLLLFGPHGRYAEPRDFTIAGALLTIVAHKSAPTSQRIRDIIGWVNEQIADVHTLKLFHMDGRLTPADFGDLLNKQERLIARLIEWRDHAERNEGEETASDHPAL